MHYLFSLVRYCQILIILKHIHIVYCSSEGPTHDKVVGGGGQSITDKMGGRDSGVLTSPLILLAENIISPKKFGPRNSVADPMRQLLDLKEE